MLSLLNTTFTNAVRKGFTLVGSLLSKLKARSTYFENKNCTKATLEDLDDVNLLEKASIITTPTAYSDGKLHSVKPVKTLGDEEVTNGDFSNGSIGWSLVGDSTISGGSASITNASQYSQITSQIFNNYLISGKTYKLEADITTSINNALAYRVIGGPINPISLSDIVDGKFTAYFTMTQDSYFWFQTTGPYTGLNATIDNVSIKEVIDADFDFQRGSAATRVNSQGLIENVQTLSGNLVQNGDFSEIGSELITNGDFSVNGIVNTSSYNLGWYSPDNDLSISDGKLIITNGASVGGRAYGTNGVNSISFLTSGKSYKLVYTIIENNDNASVSYHNGGSYVTAPNTVGTHTIYYQADGAIFILRNNTANTTITIDNVSVKEVGQNWNFVGETELTEQGARIYSSSGGQSYITQDTLTSTKNYKITYDIVDNTQGSLKLINVNGISDYPIPSTIGSHIVYFTANNNTLFIYRNSGATDITITNISVIEITDDTDLPRIDYTDGCGSLLLEPQSTNLVTQSETFSNWNTENGKQVVTQGAVISPDGTNNGNKLETYNDQYYPSRKLWIAKNVSVGQPFTFSVYIKKVDGQLNTGFLHITTGANDTFDVSQAYTATDQWQRVSVTTNSAVSSQIRFLITGDPNSQIYIWGGQVENQSFSTSYIPTNGSTATRLADVCNNAGSSDLINSTEGVLYAEFSVFDVVANSKAISIYKTSSPYSNAVILYYNGNRIAFDILNPSGNVSVVTNINNAKELNKAAIKYKSGDIALWVNGVELVTRTNTLSLSGLDKLEFDFVSNNDFYGNVKSVAVFKEALTNDELEGLTGEGYDTFNALALANNYTII